MSPRSIQATYYWIVGLYTLSAALIWGVNTLFLLDAGLDILEVFLANSAFTAGMFLFEIPTGVLADTRGRRSSFLLSVSILTLTTLAYVAVARIGGGVVAFAVVSVVMGLGFTFYSGAIEAWLVDALREAGFSGQLDRVFARGAMVTGAAMLGGTLSGGVLASVDLALPYIARAAMLAAVFILAWVAMKEFGFTPRTLKARDLPREMRAVARASLDHGWRDPPVRALMGVSFIQYGFLSWGFYAWQPYFLDLLGRDAVWVAGAIASLIAGGMIAGNALADRFSRACRKRTTLLLWAGIFYSITILGVGLAPTFWIAAALFLVSAIAMGVTGPVRQAYIHESIPSEQRATVVSFDSMFGNGGGVGAQTALGYVSRIHSIGGGYVIGGAFTLLALPLLARVRRFAGPADGIVGERAGMTGSCAAQGLPEVSLVDTARQV